jgi:hypothetical protein
MELEHVRYVSTNPVSIQVPARRTHVTRIILRSLMVRANDFNARRGRNAIHEVLFMLFSHLFDLNIVTRTRERPT